MALEGTIKLPAFGVVKKRTAVLGGLGAAGFVVVAYIYRSRKSASASSASSSGTGSAAGAVTDPAGNTCSAVNPATGFCPGTAEDLAAQQTAAGAYNTSGLGAGGLSGYYYGSGGSTQDQPPGPGNFADNAEWAQYAENFLESSAGTNPGALSAALGAYINGAPVNASQQSLIEQAIAIAGQPPQAGPNGDPPGINLQHSPSPNPNPNPKPTDKKVGVPSVTGKTRGDAQAALSAAGLKWGYTTRAIPKHAYVVATQNPRAGASVDKGTTVHMSLREKK